MSHSLDIAIIGAGAAGLSSAIFAAQTNRQLRVGLFDTASHIGAKILVSGGSRCNVTHQRVTADDYFADRQHLVKHILAGFDQRRTVEWFAGLGVKLKTEPTGKLFPVTNSAHTVLNALTDRCCQLGVPVYENHCVNALERHDDGLMVCHAHGQVHARRVILATGGRSLPKTGSDGNGYKLARSVGHTINNTYQALVPLVLDPPIASLSGVSLDVTVSTFVDGRRIDQRTGSMLLTHFGLSGPVTMDASRFYVMAQAAGHQVELRINWLIDQTFEAVNDWLVTTGGTHPKRLVSTVLADRLPQRIAQWLVAGANAEAPIGQLSRIARRALVHAITNQPLPVSQPRGWNYAEVTAGGVPLNEIDHRTMTSRKCPGLHLAGEILDCDGRIGGFNFQWAWSSGYLAGCAAAHATIADG